MLTHVNKSTTVVVLNLALLLLSTSTLAEDTASLSGVITAAGSGEPLEGITVVISDVNQHQSAPSAAQATTNSAGEWSAEVEFTFDPERSVIVEAAGPDHAPARHGGSAFWNCYFHCQGAGDEGAITVSPGDSITELDIELEPGGRIAGSVTRANDGEPLEAAQVLAFPPDAPHVRYSSHFRGVTDQTGDFESSLALPPGDYHLMAQPGPDDNYVIQAWQGYPCQFEQCPILDTDTIDIASATVTDGLDFALAPGAALSGTLTPDGIPRIVRLFDGSGRMLGDFQFPPWQPDGEEWAFTGLVGGSYYVELGPFSSTEPWLRVLHNGLLCPFAGCERATGDPLVIPPGASLTLPEVALESGGQIDGKLVDAATGEAPPALGNDYIRTYEIITGDGTVVGGGIIQAVDNEVRLLPSAALPDGAYYVRTFATFFGDSIGFQRLTGDSSGGYLPGYIDGMYPDVVCAGVKCDLDDAEKVTVTDGQITSIVIELSTGSNIEGIIVDDLTDEPIPGAIARLLSTDNEILASVVTDEDGQFWFGAFPDGDYYLRTTMAGATGVGVFDVQHRYFDDLHGADSPCSEMLCNPGDGTAITLDGSDAGPFELRVEPGPVISGRLIAQPGGLQLSNGRVEVYDSSGDFVGRYRINPGTGQYQTTALAPGDYTLVPVVSPAYSAVTSGNTAPARVAGPLSSTGFVVSIANEDVDADLPVIDVGADRIFDNRFEAED